MHLADHCNPSALKPVLCFPRHLLNISPWKGRCNLVSDAGAPRLGQDSEQLEVVVLDEEERTNTSSRLYPFGSSLHHQRLTFRSDFRPAKRYLYFAFAMNILRRQRQDVPGW